MRAFKGVITRPGSLVVVRMHEELGGLLFQTYITRDYTFRRHKKAQYWNVLCIQHESCEIAAAITSLSDRETTCTIACVR
jgi:hypothetical protein